MPLLLLLVSGGGRGSGGAGGVVVASGGVEDELDHGRLLFCVCMGVGKMHGGGGGDG